MRDYMTGRSGREYLGWRRLSHTRERGRRKDSGRRNGGGGSGMKSQRHRVSTILRLALL